MEGGLRRQRDVRAFVRGRFWLGGSRCRKRRRGDAKEKETGKGEEDEDEE